MVKQLQAAALDLAGQAGNAMGGAIGSVDSWVDALEYAIGLAERHDWPSSETGDAGESAPSPEKHQPTTPQPDKPGEVPKQPSGEKQPPGEVKASPTAAPAGESAGSTVEKVPSTAGDVPQDEQALAAPDPREPAKHESSQTATDVEQPHGLAQTPGDRREEGIKLNGGEGEVKAPSNGSMEISKQDLDSAPPLDNNGSHGSDDFNLTVEDLRTAAAAHDTRVTIHFSSFDAKTSPGEALFWSGFGHGGGDEAKQFANELGLKTLGTLLDRQGITPPDDRDAFGWGMLSYNMASSASGPVYVTAGDYLQSSAVWARIEQPILMNNPDVTSIVAIDPYSGSRQIIFSR